MPEPSQRGRRGISQYLRQRPSRSRERSSGLVLRKRHPSRVAGAAFSPQSPDRLTRDVERALRSGDRVRATSLAARVARDLVKRGELQTILDWMPKLPQLAVEQHAELLWAAARAFTYTHQLERAQHCLQRLRVLVSDDRAWRDDLLALEGLLATASEDLATIDAVIRANLPRAHSAYGLGILFNLQGGAALARAHFEEALGHFDRADRCNARAGNWLGLSATLALRAMTLASRGQLNRALACFFGEFAADGPQAALASYQQVAAGIHAELLYEAGDLPTLRRVLQAYPPTEDGYLAISMMVGGHLAAARQRWLEDGLEPALKQLDAAAERAVQRGFSRLVAACRWEQVRLATLSGDLGRAERLAARAPTLDSSVSAYYTTDLEAVDVAVLRLRARTGRLTANDGYLLRQIHEAEVAGRRWRELKLVLVQIQAQWRSKEFTAAEQNLARLLAWALPAGFRRSIIDEGDAIMSILQRWRANAAAPNEISAEHLKALLRMAPKSPADAVGKAGEADAPALSEREHDLVRALAEGWRNRELASHFQLSENTVKWYLKGLYGKLAVRNRAEAVARGRELGLLD